MIPLMLTAISWACNVTGTFSWNREGTRYGTTTQATMTTYRVTRTTSTVLGDNLALSREGNDDGLYVRFTIALFLGRSAPPFRVYMLSVFSSKCSEKQPSVRMMVCCSKLCGLMGCPIPALQRMHEVGWVHRDISTGNILVSDGQQCRLSDMEYAKRVGLHKEFRIVCRHLLVSLLPSLI